jgi:UDP-N-acetylmuramate--alanine ligase
MPDAAERMAAAALSLGIPDAAARLADLADIAAPRRLAQGRGMTRAPAARQGWARFHFIGIGGIGMSGIAEILLRLGHAVQGSDAEGSADHRAAGRAGRAIFIGQAADNVGAARRRRGLDRDQGRQPRTGRGAAARAAGGPPLRDAGRTDAPARTVSVAGTHGKTTTTTLVAALLDAGGFDPTVSMAA